MGIAQTPACIVALGGSFDPVHNGHIALARYFVDLLKPDQLRLIPTGNPWQKGALIASADQRIDMLNLAFSQANVPVVIDRQEIQRIKPSYTIDTLQSLRTELGPDTSLVFLLGADQLNQLHTWHDWQHLFNYAHLCAATRPEYPIDISNSEVKNAFFTRLATPNQIHNQPHGLTYLANDLAEAISATQIRATLAQGERPSSLIPAVVLDYIDHNCLYI